MVFVKKFLSYPLALGLAACIAACSSNNAPIRHASSIPPNQVEYATVRPESGEIQAANIDRLYPNKRLFVCRGIRVQNKPKIDANHEVINYGRLVVVKGPGGEVPVVTAPANNACVSSGFGMRGLFGEQRMHNGIDITSRPASYVFSGASGKVLEAGKNSGYGLAVLLDHGKGVYTRYAHLEYINDDIKVGANLVYGHPIGRMGNSGRSTGIHLHYEILTGRYQSGVWGRGLDPHNPFSFPVWVDPRLQ